MTAVFLRSLCLLALLCIGAAPAAAKVNEASQQASRLLAGKGTEAVISGDFVRARRLLEEAIVADPANAHALAALGRLYQSHKDADMARKYYRFALEVEPVEPDALFGAATLDIADGDADAANDKLRKLQLSCPACRQTNELASALREKTPEPGQSLDANKPATHP